ncbi:MAG: hypothetical protein H7A40_05725 [Chlamydiales bacterium]|nr:hypothetical protein [Chlamydiales bacterium]
MPNSVTCVQKHSNPFEGILIRPEYGGESKIEGIDKNLYSFNNVEFKNADGQDLELGEYHIAAKSLRVALLALETLARQSQNMTPAEFAKFKNTYTPRVLSFGEMITDHHRFPRPWKAREGFATVYRQHDTFIADTYLFGKNTPFSSHKETLKYDHPYITRLERLAELLNPKPPGKPPVKAQVTLEEVDDKGAVFCMGEQEGVKIKIRPEQEVIRFEDPELSPEDIKAAEQAGYGQVFQKYLS